MQYKQMREVEALANNLKRTIPASHKDLWTVHKAPALVAEVMEDVIESLRLEAVADYIGSFPEGERDDVKLREIQGKIKMRRNRIDEAAGLKNELLDIAIDYEIERVAESFGAKNPALVSMALKDAETVTHAIDNVGNVAVLVDGRPIKEVIKRMMIAQETNFLFDSSKASGASGDWTDGNMVYSGPNPWKRGPNFNLTEQGRILRQNRALAEKLKQEAEFSLM